MKELGRIDYMRSVILQKLFELDDCSSLCDGLTDLSPKCMMALATRRFGSFVLDRFLQSNSVLHSKKKTFVEANLVCTVLLFQLVYPCLPMSLFM